jgi:hypothetical protein
MQNFFYLKNFYKKIEKILKNYYNENNKLKNMRAYIIKFIKYIYINTDYSYLC